VSTSPQSEQHTSSGWNAQWNFDTINQRKAVVQNQGLRCVGQGVQSLSPVVQNAQGVAEHVQ
jgi:hypothetical protein